MNITETAHRSEKVYVYGFPQSRYETVNSFVREVLNRYSFGGKETMLVDIGGFRDNLVLKKTFPGTNTLSFNVPEEYTHLTQVCNF